MIASPSVHSLPVSPTALDIATKEYHAAEDDWRVAMILRHTGRAGARAYRAACDALIAARQSYASAFRAEQDGGDE